MPRRTVIGRLEEHPNLDEVLGVLAQLAHVRDAELPRLADRWTNDHFVAAARDKALSPDSPLVCEVLSAFEAVSALFAEDVRGEQPYLVVDPATAVAALKAVRDAIAGAYARPVLSRGEHAALMRPWRSVYPSGRACAPDLGPQAADVRALLAELPRLAERCHDAEGRTLWDGLVDRSYVDESERADARESAFSAAVLTGRRRVWALVRRSGAEGLGRGCRTCRTDRRLSDSDRETERVLGVCLDAACALLVADALPDTTTNVLVAPLSTLVPLQRRPDLRS